MTLKKGFGLWGVALIGAVLLVAILATAVFAQGTGPGMMQGQGKGPGMMGSTAPITPTLPIAPAAQGGYGMRGQGGSNYGPGMMGGSGGIGGMMQRFGDFGRGMTGRNGGRGMPGFDFSRGGPGMMGGMMGSQGYARPGATAQRLTNVQVQKAVADFMARYYNAPDLEVVELMEFEQNFYAQVAEKSTKINAFELLVDPFTGAVQPEYGPNMMWNTKYGHMSGMGGMMSGDMMNGLAPVQPTAEMPVKPDQVAKLAQAYLDAQKTGLTVEKGLDIFYGYYTIHTVDKAGKTIGMLSVNGYTGQVWYHTWHGPSSAWWMRCRPSEHKLKPLTANR